MKPQKNISDCILSLKEDSYVFDGTPKTPEIILKSGDTVLTEGTDYALSYKNNVNAGTATFTVTGKGNYTGIISQNFKILKAGQVVSAEIDKTEIEIGEKTNIRAEGNGKIFYQCDVEDIVSIDESGIVTGKKAGEVIISVTAEGDDNYEPDTVKLALKV